MRKLRKRKPQQIPARLEMTEALQADSTSRTQACRQLDISEASPCPWHRRYGLMRRYVA